MDLVEVDRWSCCKWVQLELMEGGPADDAIPFEVPVEPVLSVTKTTTQKMAGVQRERIQQSLTYIFRVRR